MKPLPLVAFTMLVLVPFFFICYEIARIMGWSEPLLSAFETWVPAIMATVTVLTAVFVPWIASSFGDQDRRP